MLASSSVSGFRNRGAGVVPSRKLGAASGSSRLYAWCSARQVLCFLLVVFPVYLHVVHRLMTPAVVRTPALLHFAEHSECPPLQSQQPRYSALPGDPPGKPPQKPKIAILTFQANLPADVVFVATVNKRRYAELHGYSFIVADREIVDHAGTRPAAWAKFSLLLKYLPEYHYVMWMDTDALFMNPVVRIEQVVDTVHDVFVSTDHNDVNSGVFIVRNTEWSRWFLRECDAQTWLVDMEGAPFAYEQRALHYMYNTEIMRDFLENHRPQPLQPFERADEVRHHTRILPPCALNSNPCEEFKSAVFLWRARPLGSLLCGNEYHAGDFIVHVAGKNPLWYRWFLLRGMARSVNLAFGV